MEQVKSLQRGSAKKKVPARSRRYGADFKLQVVRKFLEESVPIEVIRQECGISINSVRRWVRAYRSEGEAGFATRRNGNGRGLPSPVKQKIVS